MPINENPSLLVYHLAMEHVFRKIINFLFSYIHILLKYQRHLLKNKLRLNIHNIYDI